MWDEKLIQNLLKLMKQAPASFHIWTEYHQLFIYLNIKRKN